MTHHLRQILKRLYWAGYSQCLSNPPLPIHFRRILFICKGNICRSPFAHYYALKSLTQGNQISVGSAGLHAKSDAVPPDAAIEAARLLNVDMAAHRPCPLGREDIDRSDAIFVMEPWQRRILSKEYPEHKLKIHLLSLLLKDTDFYGTPYQRCNIQDPYGKELQAFIDTFRRIQAAVDKILLGVDYPAPSQTSLD
jgi:protein-tyrosine phosphatase